LPSLSQLCHFRAVTSPTQAAGPLAPVLVARDLTLALGNNNLSLQMRAGAVPPMACNHARDRGICKWTLAVA